MGVLAGCVFVNLEWSELRDDLIARCVLADGELHAARIHPLAAERNGAQRLRLPLSARLGYESCIKKNGEREKSVRHVFLFPAH